MPSASSSPGSAAAERAAAACVVATVAFWACSRTLLPGVDAGDTGGFQAAVLWPELSARRAYPLYYGLARPFVQAVSPANPAGGLNLFSALWAACAAGLLAWLAATLTRSLAAGAVAGLLLAFSYTFWSQAIIAEVYTLHLALVAACLIALHWYARRPGTGRLALFFGIYAAAFGNHLSMILFLVPFAAFLLLTTPEPRRLFRRPIVGLALLCASAGALLYLPSLLSVWNAPDAPPGALERLSLFWRDTTKADWRETMVLGVPPGMTLERLLMWGFDARQQFGIPGLVLAAAGAVTLWRRSRPWAITILLAFAINTIFALTYNVGDSHVFFLPGHFLTALCAGVAAGALVAARDARRRGAYALLAVLAIGYAVWRGYDTWPAMDRTADRRAEQAIARLTLGLGAQDVLVSQMSWQLENVLLYTTRYVRPGLPWVRLRDVEARLPGFVAAQHARGRDVVLTPAAAARVAGTDGPAWTLIRDPLPAAVPLSSEAARPGAGSPYVVVLLTPLRDERLDEADVSEALSTLTGGRVTQRSMAAYEVIAGRAGEAPLVHRAGARPFTERVVIDAARLTVRLDAWLPFDTFRRPGFGHVIWERTHAMIVERGVNLVWFDADGRPSPPVYAAGLYAPMSRFRLPVTAVPDLAALDARPGSAAPWVISSW